jgi:uncharacterized membrane protein YfcA
MDPTTVAFVIAVVLIASTAQTVTGFGFALIAVPFMVIVLDVRDAVVMVGLLGWLNSTLVARAVWRHVPTRAVATMLIGSFVGMPLGLLVLLTAPDDALRLAVGVSSIVMAAALMSGVRWRGGDRAGELVAGAVSGVLNTSTGMNGPPIVLYLQDRGYPKDEFRGALSAFFFVSSLVSFAIFALNGVISADALVLAAVAAPAVFAGNWAGRHLLGRLSDETFRRLVLALLVATALAAVVTALIKIAG